MRQKLPQDAATAEFLEKHGMVDMVVNRPDIPGILQRLIRIYTGTGSVLEGRRLVGQHA
jgi:acetyl-CoA carboxylase carboxyl transferase subunit beta